MRYLNGVFARTAENECKMWENRRLRNLESTFCCNLDTVMITAYWLVSGVSICFGLYLFLLAGNSVSGNYLYKFKTYGLHGITVFYMGDKIYAIRFISSKEII
jgi:hypothetical protein